MSKHSTEYLEVILVAYFMFFEDRQSFLVVDKIDV